MAWGRRLRPVDFCVVATIRSWRVRGGDSIETGDSRFHATRGGARRRSAPSLLVFRGLVSAASSVCTGWSGQAGGVQAGDRQAPAHRVMPAAAPISNEDDGDSDGDDGVQDKRGVGFRDANERRERRTDVRTEAVNMRHRTRPEAPMGAHNPRRQGPKRQRAKTKGAQLRRQTTSRLPTEQTDSPVPDRQTDEQETHPS